VWAKLLAPVLNLLKYVGLWFAARKSGREAEQKDQLEGQLEDAQEAEKRKNTLESMSRRDVASIVRRDRGKR